MTDSNSNSTGGSADPTDGDPTAAYQPPPSPPADGPETRISSTTEDRRSAALSAGNPDAAHAPNFPGYEVLGPPKRGGMGVVYRARKLGLNREAAIKVIRSESSTPTADVLRFLAEAEAVAALNHPHIVGVYDVCLDGSQPHIAFEYLPGGTLADRLRPSAGSEERVRFAPAYAAALLGKLASAAAAAHAAGIVHRDIKPGNVMFDAADEPKLTDFGIAKRAASDLTLTGQVIGTPDYMSPEQAKGETKFVGPPADVWALGVVLYECLTGTRPFRAGTTAAVLERVRTARPERVRELAPDAPRDLEWICRKCLEKDPADRYPSAKELAEDLVRFQRGKTIAARPPSLARQARRWARRNPVPAAVGALLFLALLGTSVSAVVAFRSERDRANAVQNQLSAERDRAAAETAARAELLEKLVLRGQFRDTVAACDRAERDGLLTPAMRLSRIRALAGFADTERVRQESATVPFDDLPADLRGSFELWKAVNLYGVDDPEAERLIRLALTRPLPPGDREYAEGALAPTTPEAVDHFLKAIRHDHLHQPARAAACSLLHISGRLNEAIDLAEQSAALFPEWHHFLTVVMSVAGLLGDETRVQTAADRLTGRLPKDVLDDSRAANSALAASWRVTRSSFGYGKAQPGDLLKVAPVQVRAGQFILQGGADRLGKGAETLPPAHRKVWQMYAEVYGVLGRGQFAGANTPEFRQRLAAATRLHPEGFLLLIQAVFEFFWAFQLQPTTPESTDEYIRAVNVVLETAQRAAGAPAMFEVHDIAADIVFQLNGVLSNPEALGAKADRAKATRAIELLRVRVRRWDDLPGEQTLFNAVKFCAFEKEYELGRTILDVWLRDQPDNVHALRWRAELEFAAGGYPAAVRAATRVLEQYPDEHAMKELRAAARRRFVDLETAPPPRPR